MLHHKDYNGGTIQLTPKEIARADEGYTVVVRPQPDGTQMVSAVAVATGKPVWPKVIYVDDPSEIRLAVHDMLRMMNKTGFPGGMADRSRDRFWEKPKAAALKVAGNTAQQLEELTEGWRVELWSDGGSYVIGVQQNSSGRTHIYRGSSVANVVSRAWAGEPGDKAASTEKFAVAFPREYYLTPELKSQPPFVPEGTDLAIWKWTNPSGTLGAIAFAAKQNKPLWFYSFKNEATREALINDTILSRKSRMKMMQDRKDEKAGWAHSLVVGSILYSSWGYDQTNIDFYEVTAVAGKSVVIREIAKKAVSGDSFTESVVPVKGRFVGQAMKKLPSKGYQGRASIRLTTYSSAWEWDGKPKSQTGPHGGH